jgi:hypothetical protein
MPGHQAKGLALVPTRIQRVAPISAPLRKLRGIVKGHILAGFQFTAPELPSMPCVGSHRYILLEIC